MKERLFSVPVKLDEMHVRAGKGLSTDTYFGCFSCEAYTAHTSLHAVSACIRLAGRGSVTLMRLGGDGGAPVAAQAFSGEARLDFPIPIEDYPKGCFYLLVEGQADIREIWYEGEGEARPLRLAIVLCTYRREDAVRQNLELLSAAVNGDAFLRECVEIYCVDNGGTLAEAPEPVRLISNRNYGGSGGYARGMMEARGCTHCWLMDDDIGIEPELVRRAATFLRYRREEVRLAAGMFSFEQPTVQQEATAIFDGYTFHSSGAGLDFRDPAALLKNALPEASARRYAGWWSMIFPATEALPMPFFIKLDDVEFGLRGREPFVVMNGFGVWHEAFGKKGNAWAEYYTTRNALILQSLYPNLGHSAVKTMLVRLLKSLAYGEPKCMEAALRGAEDFAAGAAAFAQVDAEARHREIMARCGARLTGDMTRGKMLLRALYHLPRQWRSVGLFFRAVRAARRQDGAAWRAMGTRAFWEQYLEKP